MQGLTWTFTASISTASSRTEPGITGIPAELVDVDVAGEPTYSTIILALLVALAAVRALKRIVEDRRRR